MNPLPPPRERSPDVAHAPNRNHNLSPDERFVSVKMKFVGQCYCFLDNNVAHNMEARFKQWLRLCDVPTQA